VLKTTGFKENPGRQKTSGAPPSSQYTVKLVPSCFCTSSNTKFIGVRFVRSYRQKLALGPNCDLRAATAARSARLLILRLRPSLGDDLLSQELDIVGSRVLDRDISHSDFRYTLGFKELANEPQDVGQRLHRE